MITTASNTTTIGSVSFFQNGADPSVAQLANGNVVVVWTETLIFGGGVGYTDTDGAVFARVFDASGAPVSDAVQVNTTELNGQNLPQVAGLTNGGFAVSWTNTTLLAPGEGIDTDIHARVFSNAGAPVTGEIVVSVDTPTPGSTDDDNDASRILALADGGFAVTYSVGLGDGVEIQQYSAAGAPIGAPQQVFPQATFMPASTQLANGDIVHILDGAFDPNSGYTLRISGADVTDAPSGVPGAVAPVLIETGAAGDYRSMRVEPLSTGGFVAVAACFPSTSESHFRIAIFDASYALTKTFDVPREILSGASRYEYDLVGLNEGGFVLTYAATDADGLGLFGRAFTNDGTSVGGETLLLPVTAGAQIDADYAQTGTGEITAVFTDYGQTATPLFLASARFSVTGTDAGPAPITGTPDADMLTGTPAADTILADAGDDELRGLAGDDVLNGEAGDDLINGGAGNDTIDGGDGIDTASYEDASAGVQVYLNAGLSRGADGYDRLTGIENLIGSDFDDRLVGTTGANDIKGGDGNDILKGKGGTDTFLGGNGDDRIRGGDDVDSMQGEAGSDILLGLSGNDTLDGGTGVDYIYGGRDSDTITGGLEGDFLRGNVGGDTIHGEDGNDDIRGGGNGDVLNGDAGNDYLLGEGGTDILRGGAGDDTLLGGFGAGVLDGVRDTFVFASTADGAGGFDRIRDFEDGIDVIDLTAFGFTDFATDVFALASNAGSAMRIDFGGGDVIYIDGFQTSAFDSGDVILS